MADVLLIGAGDLGTQIGLTLADRGLGVVAVRRRASIVPAPLVGVSGDVADGLPALPQFDDASPRLLVICLTAGGRDENAYRTVFLDGVARVLDDVRARGWAPERALFVSSTGVCAQAGVVDEDTPPQPSTATSSVLLEAERAFLAALPAATRGIVLRPSGLYGPGREWFIDQVRRGAVSSPERITHRIHRDDAARAVAHLLTMDRTPEQLYLATDDTAAPARDVAAFIAAELGLTTSGVASNVDGPDSVGARGAMADDAVRDRKSVV